MVSEGQIHYLKMRPQLSKIWFEHIYFHLFKLTLTYLHLSAWMTNMMRDLLSVFLPFSVSVSVSASLPCASWLQSAHLQQINFVPQSD